MPAFHRGLRITVRVNELVIELAIAVGFDVVQQLFGCFCVAGLREERGCGHFFRKGIQRGASSGERVLTLSSVRSGDLGSGSERQAHCQQSECQERDRHDQSIASIAGLSAGKEAADPVRFHDRIRGKPQDDQTQR